MKQFLSITSKLITFLAITGLCIVVWFSGEIIEIANWHPLRPISTRIVIIAIILLGLLVKLLLSRLYTKNADRQLISSFQKIYLLNQKGDDKRVPKQFRKQIAQSIKQLRAQRLMDGKKSKPLSKLPWFLVIGSPGFGKTSLIENSGLNIACSKGDELSIEKNQNRIFNFGWWVTDEAVFLEVTRYNKDSHWNASSNSIAWLEILKTLKKYQKLRSISGVIVITDVGILMSDEHRQNEGVQSVKQYLQDLYQQLRIKCPVYSVFTKCDLIAGFQEFFSHSNKEERSQIFGVTLPYHSGNVIELIATKFDMLIQNLNERLLPLFNKETDPNKRKEICFFPQQMIILKNILIEKFKEVFIPNKLYKIASLQGVYFTSARPQGETTYDFYKFSVTNSLNLKTQTNKIDPTVSHSYFLKDLFQEITTRHLKIYNPKIYTIKNWIRKTISFITLSITLIGLLSLSMGYFYNHSFLLRVKAALQDYGVLRANLTNLDSSIANTLPILNALKKPIDMYEQDPNKWILSIPFYHSQTVISAINVNLQNELQHAFLPRILNRLEDILIQYRNQPNLLIMALKGYLYLGNPQQFPRSWLQEAMNYDWNHDSSLNPMQRKSLKDYLDLELQTPFQSFLLDKQLIDQVNTILQHIDWSASIYSQLKEFANDQKLAPLDLYKQLGQKARDVFFSASDIQIPALYSHQGYFNIYSRHLPWISSSIIGNVISLSKNFEHGSNFLDQQMSNVTNLYVADYVTQWKNAINELNIVTFNTIDTAIADIDTLTNNDSPLINLLTTLQDNTNLTIKNNHQIKQNFASLVNLNSNGQLNNLMKSLRNLSAYLKGINANKNVNLASYAAAREILLSPNNNPIANLLQQATPLPAPIQNWMNTLAINCWRILLTNSRVAINSIWRTNVIAKPTPQALNAFIQSYLKPFINTTAMPWQQNRLYGYGLDISANALAQLQFSKKITKMIPAISYKNPLIFDLKPLTLSSNAASVSLSVGDQQLMYRHDPQYFTSFIIPYKGHDGIEITFYNFNHQVAAKILLTSSRLISLLQNHPVFSITVGNYRASFQSSLKSKNFEFSQSKFRLPKSL